MGPQEQFSCDMVPVSKICTCECQTANAVLIITRLVCAPVTTFDCRETYDGIFCRKRRA